MPKITKPLTYTEIDRAKPKDKPYTLTDGNGLFLLVQSTGFKSWRFNYIRPNTNKRVKISLGTYPEISLAQARAKRDEYRALLAQDIDPQIRNQKIEEQSSLLAQNTFKVVCERWFTEIYPTRANEETRIKNWVRLENHIFPKIGDMPLDEIKPKRLIEIYRDIGASNTLDKLHRLVIATLNYGIKLGIIEGHNCNLAKEDFIAPLAKSHPSITPDKLPELLSTMNNAFYNGKLEPNTFLAFNLTVLTSLRQIELTRLRWEFINDECITVPSELMKQTRTLKEQPQDHVIPLSSQVKRLLNTIRLFNGASPFLFPRVRNRNKTICKDTVAHALRDNGYRDKQDAHGLRSLYRTYLSKLGFEKVVGELAIAHLSTGKDKVQAIYDRYDYLEERKEAFQKWGDYCEQCGILLDYDQMMKRS